MRIMMTTIGLVACATAFGYLQAGPSEEYRETFSYNRELGAGDEISLENINGDVSVTGVEGLSSVEIKGTRIVRDHSTESAKSHINDISIDMKSSGQGLAVKTIQPDGINSREYMVVYEVRVPSGWKVSVNNVNGDVKIASISNGVTVDLVNGEVGTSHIAGSLEATIVNGQFTGDAVLPENGSCKLETTNGEITAKLTVPPSAKCALETTNGGITLSLPKSVSASVSAETSVGEIAVNGLTFSKQKRSNDMSPGGSFEGVLGSGSGSIKLSTTNGEIALKGF